MKYTYKTIYKYTDNLYNVNYFITDSEDIQQAIRELSSIESIKFVKGFEKLASSAKILETSEYNKKLKINQLENALSEKEKEFINKNTELASIQDYCKDLESENKTLLSRLSKEEQRNTSFENVRQQLYAEIKELKIQATSLSAQFERAEMFREQLEEKDKEIAELEARNNTLYNISKEYKAERDKYKEALERIAHHVGFSHFPESTALLSFTDIATKALGEG